MSKPAIRSISADSAMSHDDGKCACCNAHVGTARVAGICFTCWDEHDVRPWNRHAWPTKEA